MNILQALTLLFGLWGLAVVGYLGIDLIKHWNDPMEKRWRKQLASGHYNLFTKEKE